MERLLALRDPLCTSSGVAAGNATTRARPRALLQCSNTTISGALRLGSGTLAKALVGLRPQEWTQGTAGSGDGDSVNIYKEEIRRQGAVVAWRHGGAATYC